jgi:antitoxin ParD1/3/4
MPSSYVIGDHFESFIKEQIQLGRYASASEVVRDGLRALEDGQKLRTAKLEALRLDIQRGAESGASNPGQGGVRFGTQAHRPSKHRLANKSVRVVFSPAALAD